MAKKKVVKKTKAKKLADITAQVQKQSAPLIEIRQKGDSKRIMVGANTELLIDGKPLRGAQSITLDISARAVARATITMVGRFQFTGRPLTKTIKLYK